jgi:hypothetical protein
MVCSSAKAPSNGGAKAFMILLVVPSEQLLRTPAADGAGKCRQGRSELSMFGPGKANRARGPVAARCDSGADIYDRHADGLYRQALLTLGDAGLAEQVVCDVIVDECTRVPSSAGGTGDASYRLPVSAYRRCRELAHGPSWHNRPPGQRVAGGVARCIDPCGLLSWEERGALGLVLFGGLGYLQASHEVAISPLDTAALLRAVLHRLAPSPATGRPSPATSGPADLRLQAHPSPAGAPGPGVN